jgi:hypothetical protein
VDTLDQLKISWMFAKQKLQILLVPRTRTRKHTSFHWWLMLIVPRGKYCRVVAGLFREKRVAADKTSEQSDGSWTQDFPAHVWHDELLVCWWLCCAVRAPLGFVGFRLSACLLALFFFAPCWMGSTYTQLLSRGPLSVAAAAVV